jgi:hypothetical protein
VVALVTALLISFLGFGAIVVYGKRRPVGAPLSWGEALVAAVLGFALMFWSYGVVPHQWLTYAGNELSWRPDAIMAGPKLWFTGKEGILQYFLPFQVNKENMSHIVVVGIYGLYLTLHVVAFTNWQNRAKKQAQVPELTSEYGRPLVKQG